jgi:hypothetical protein
MCLFGGTPKPPAVQAPKETQFMKEPDGGMVSAEQRRRITDRMRATAQTVLTNPLGMSTSSSPSARPTLLGS